MNAKIERTIAAIDVTKEKIAKLQDKLRLLQQQRIELEDDEIIALFRKERLTGCDLAAFIRTIRSDADTEPANATTEPIYEEEPPVEEE
jgi:hypothetical protein